MKEEERLDQQTFGMINNQIKMQKEMMDMMNFSDKIIISIN